MRRWIARGGMLAFALAAAATTASAQNDEIKSFRGLPGVGVQVQGLTERSNDPAVMTTTAIQADLEAQLRQAGIRVLTRAEVAQFPSRPSLKIELGFLQTPTGISFYEVFISMNQWAVLSSGQGLSVRTWVDADSEWTAGTDRDRRVRDAIKEEVNRFINAWRLANAQ
jgi:hypothetical protein